MSNRASSRRGKSGPLVSVIVPAYNTRHTVKRTLDSVLAQTYSNFEVIVVDDGSPDGVGEYVEKEYGARIKLIRQDNKGLAGARNTGAKASRGEYLCFLDSDDWWTPNKLDEQVAQIALDPEASVLYSNCFFYEDGVKKGEWTDIHNQGSGNILEQLIKREVMLPVLTAMVRKKDFETVGRFDEGLREVEDYDLWLRMASRGFKFSANPRPLAYYYINPKGLSSNKEAMFRAHIVVYRRLLKSTNDGWLRKLIKLQIAVYILELASHREQRRAGWPNLLLSARTLSAKVGVVWRKLALYLPVKKD